MFGFKPEPALKEVTSVTVQLNFQITKGRGVGKHRTFGDMDTWNSFFSFNFQFS